MSRSLWLTRVGVQISCCMMRQLQSVLLHGFSVLAAFLSSHSLSFNLIHEIEIALIEMVHSDVSILSTTSISIALRVDCDCVQRTKVTSNSSDLVFENLVVKSCFEFALSCGCSGDIHGCLSASKNDKIFPRGYCSCIQWCISNEILQDLESSGREDFCSLVFACGDEVRAVARELDIVDGCVIFVGLDVDERFASLPPR